MTDEKTPDDREYTERADGEGVEPVKYVGPPGGEASTGRVRGTHSPGRAESKDRGVAERGETK